MADHTPESLRELADEIGWLRGIDAHAAKIIDALRAYATHLEAECKDAARLDSGCIVIDSRDEFGEPLSTHHHGVDLRAAIDKAMAYEAARDTAMQAEGETK